MESTMHAQTDFISDRSPRQATWRLSVLSAAHGVTHMRGAILPLVYPMLMTSMGFGYVDLGLLLTVTRFIGGLLQGIWGTVARFVPGKNLIAYENLGVAVGTGICGLTHSYGELVGAVTFGQVAASPHHPIASAMLSRWFSKKRRGSAQSIHFAAANVATVITPLVATGLIRWIGWRDTLFVFTIPGVLIALLLWMSLPSEMVAPKSKKRAGHPARLGLEFLQPLRDPLVRRLIATASVTAGGKGIGIVQTFLPLFFLDELKLSHSATGLLFTVFTITSVLGPVVAGKLSDRMDRSKCLSGLLVGAGTFALGLAFVGSRSMWLMIPVLIVFGMFVYGFSPVEQTIMSDITSAELQASAYSLFFSVTFTVSAGWPILLSVILNALGFPALFATLALSYFVGAVLYMTGKWNPTASDHAPSA